MSWIETTVGNFCPFTYGKAIKKQDQLNSGYPVYGSNGMYTHSATPLIEPYSVIVGRKGSVGRVHLSDRPCWVSDTAFYVRYECLEDAFFTYYLLSSLGLEGMNTDAAVPGLNRDNAHRLEIRILKDEEKRRELVRPLINFDKKIQLNHQINQTLEQMAQAIFKSWFVDFEPVKAKMAAKESWQALQAEGEAENLPDLETWMNLAAMQVISGQTEAALNQMADQQPEQFSELFKTAALFPAAMQDSELGEIPEGWDCLALDEIAKYQNGLALQKFRPENEDDYLPVVKIAQLKKGYTDGEEKASPNIKSDCIIDNGDVVFSWSGSLMVDTWCGGKAALNQHLFKVTSIQWFRQFHDAIAP